MELVKNWSLLKIGFLTQTRMILIPNANDSHLTLGFPLLIFIFIYGS